MKFLTVSESTKEEAKEKLLHVKAKALELIQAIEELNSFLEERNTAISGKDIVTMKNWTSGVFSAEWQTNVILFKKTETPLTAKRVMHLNVI